MKTAIAFLTKDRPELTRLSVVPLLDGARNHHYHLFWCDGSTVEANEYLVHELGYPTAVIRRNVRGGADAAIVYALTEMLNHDEQYTHVGLCENDVLLPQGWAGPTLALFQRGAADSLAVGAVSARAYEDRILFQRDGYAVMHNLGAGMVVFTREAAQLVLANYRTYWSTDNRRTFMQLTGKDIGLYWAFRGQEHFLTADWGFDATLARHGLASLALVPSAVEMLGQDLAEQGLAIARKPVEVLRDDEAFKLFVKRTALIRCGNWTLPGGPGRDQWYHFDGSSYTMFPQQIEREAFGGDWRLQWSQGFGPFAWKCGVPGYQDRSISMDTLSEVPQPPEPTQLLSCCLLVPVSGPCAVIVNGGANGGRFKVEDLTSGYVCDPRLDPHQTIQIAVPAGVSYRDILITALDPGVVFLGLQTMEPQPWVKSPPFDHSQLPPV